MSNVKQIIDITTEKYAQVSARATEDGLQVLFNALSNLNDSSSASWIKLSAPALETITLKLENGVALSPEDAALVKTAVVGDAQHYLQVEKDYDRWLAELGEQMGKIKSFSREGLSAAELQQLNGLVTDTLNLIVSIQKVASAKERIARFEKATTNMDRQGMTILRNLLKEQVLKKTH